MKNRIVTLKSITLGLTLILPLSFSYAQEEVKALSLQECIDYALENQEMLKNKYLDEEIAQKDIKETISTGLPQINGSGQLIRNIEVQNGFAPGNAFNPNGDPNSVFAVGFAVPYQGDIKAEASQLLFSSTFLVGLKAAKTYKELSQKQTIQTKIDVIANVTKAYYGTLINEHRLGLTNIVLEQLDTLYQHTKERYEVGMAEKIDYQQVEVNFNNNVTEKKNLERLIAFNYAQLKFQMGMDMSEELKLSDKIDDSFLAELDTDSITPDFTNRIEYSILNTSIDLQVLDMKNYKSQYLPTLSAFGTLGWNTGAIGSEGVFSSDDGVGWLDYSFIGLNLSVPIFDGLKKSAQVQKAKIKIRQLENQRAQLVKQMNLELTQASISFYTGLDRYEIQKDNLALAKDVYESTIDKQKIGVSSMQDVLDIKALYKEAETNYYGALYDLLIAKVDREKALGTLDK